MFKENLCCMAIPLALTDLMMVIRMTETCSPKKLTEGHPIIRFNKLLCLTVILMEVNNILVKNCGEIKEN